MGQITLKKLAELSGLSIRTVSRVLKNQAYVVPEKRELVLKLAEQYHYLPNMAARNLRLQKKSFVGILSSNPTTAISCGIAIFCSIAPTTSAPISAR